MTLRVTLLTIAIPIPETTTTIKKINTTTRKISTATKKATTTTKRLATSTKAAAAALRTLAPGTYFDYGLISDTLWWQSTGTLTLGCPSGVSGLAIDDCYHAHLAATGNLQSTVAPPGAPVNQTLAQTLAQRAFDYEADAALYDEHTASYFEAFPEQLDALRADQALDSDEGAELVRRDTAICPASNSTGTTAPTTTVTERQRIEFYSWPGVPAGDTWTYVWKSYQSTGTKATTSFFHSWQLLRRDACTASPVIGSDLHTVSGKSMFAIADYRAAASGTPPAVALSTFLGKTIQHTITVKYGTKGTFSYRAVDVTKPTVALMAYAVRGNMGSSGSIKFGNYRRYVKGLSEVDTYVGDYTAKQVA